MKKLHLPFYILLFVILPGCVKKTENPGSSATAVKPPAPSPTPTTILQWQKPYGSSANELGFDIANTLGGGYIIAGSTVGNDLDVSGHHGGIGADAWIAKIDGDGNIDWQKCFGGTNGDYAYDIIAASDGGYVFAGMTQSGDGDVSGIHGGQDAWVVKMDADGELLWQKSLGGSADEIANSIIQTSDGGFLVLSATPSNDGDVSGNHGGSDAWIIKLNGTTGNIEWQKTYGGTLGESANSIFPLTDGKYMVCGSAQSTNGDLSGQINRGGKDAWLFKIDGSGNIEWQKTYGGSGSEEAGSIHYTTGGYVFSSTTNSNNGDVSGNHGSTDTWVVKIDLSGNKIWQKCFGGADGDNALVRLVNPSGQILVVGSTLSRNGDIIGYKGSTDLWVLLLDANGNKLNSTVLGGKGADTGEDAVVTSDGMYMGIGRTDSSNGDVTGNRGLSDIWMVKFKF